MAAPLPDLGGEADLIGAAGKPPERPTFSRRWRVSMRAYARVPITVGLGPRNDGRMGLELHSPARIPGARPTDWNYSGITHPMNAQLVLSAENADLAGHLFIESAASTNASYADLVDLGGISDAYMTFKFPKLVDRYAGLAINVGVFSHRYGAAGPWQQSTGYYRTPLFGKLQVAGETVVLDLYPSDGLEIILEHGLGSKLEVMPFRSSASNPPAPFAEWLPYQGPVPQGSNFVHHAHAAVVLEDQLRIAGHYLTSWTPNDWRDYGEPWMMSPPAAPEGRLTVYGGEIHFDHERAGNGYIGYSHVEAENILPLSNGVALIHSDFGHDFARNYFGGLPESFANQVAKCPTTPPTPCYTDSGTVDTVLFQYSAHLAPILGRRRGDGADLGVGVYSMASFPESVSGKETRLKFGADLEASLLRFLGIGVRFDRVMPDMDDSSTTYSAISPRVILQSSFLSREYFLLGYSRFIYGSAVSPAKPYAKPQRPDPNMYTVSTVVSF